MPFPDLTSHLTLMVERPIGVTGIHGRNNLPNPTGVNGGFGWQVFADNEDVNPTGKNAGTLFRIDPSGSATDGLRFGPGTSVTNAEYVGINAKIPVPTIPSGGGTQLATIHLSGLYHGLQNFASGVAEARLTFRSADGTFLGDQTTTLTASDTTRFQCTRSTPAGSVSCDITLQMRHSTNGSDVPNTARMDVSQLTAVYLNADYAGATPVPYYARPATETNVLGELHEISVVRDPSLGTLTAVMTDPVLGGVDPAAFFLRGYQVRLLADSESVFTGKVQNVASEHVIDAEGQTHLRVTLTAIDPLGTLGGMTVNPLASSPSGFAVDVNTTRVTGYNADAITRSIADITVPWLIETSSNPATPGFNYQPATETVWDQLPVEDCAAAPLVRAWAARHTSQVWADRTGRLRISHLDRTFESTVPDWDDSVCLLTRTLIGDNTEQQYSTINATLRNWSTALSVWNSSTYVVSDGGANNAGPASRDITILTRAADVAATIGSRARNWLKGGVFRHICYQTALEIKSSSDITVGKALIDIGNRVTTSDLSSVEDAESAGLDKRVTALRHWIVARPKSQGGSFWIMEADLAIDPRYF